MTIHSDWLHEEARIFDVVIIGSGPAAFFAATTLVRQCTGIKIAILEKSSELGGSGARSDGKLTKDPTGRVGGYLFSEKLVKENDYLALMEQVEALYVEFGGNRDRMFGYDDRNAETVASLQQTARDNSCELHTFPITHLGTDTAQQIVNNVFEFLQSQGVSIFTETMAIKTLPNIHDHLHGVVGINCEREYYFAAEHVIVAPGRSGSRQSQEMLSEVGVEIIEGKADIGVRVECANSYLEEATQIVYEFKCYTDVTTTDGSHIGCRTFCMCPNGWVSVEKPKHVRDAQYLIANGHSHSDPAMHTKNCNFAFLATVDAPHGVPALEFIENVAVRCCRAAHGNGVVVQIFEDFINGIPSTIDTIQSMDLEPATEQASDAVPGNLAKLLPRDVVTALRTGLQRMLKIFNIPEGEVLIYGAEVKAYASRMKLDPEKGFMTNIDGIYAAGDGSGLTRGLCQASMMGILVAEAITQKIEHKQRAA